MDGGGLRVLAPGLTNADAIANAIVGAARAYGDDPVKAVTTPVGSGAAGRAGRAVIAAISALATANGDVPRLARMFGRSPATIRSTRADRRPEFGAAERAARAAVQAAQTKARLAWSQVDIEDEPELVELAAEPQPNPDLEPAPEPEPVPQPAIERGREIEGPTARPVQLLGGVFTAHTRPAQIEPRPVQPHGSLSDRILAVLQRGPRNTSSLAIELDVKELVVGQCLSALRHKKLVRSDASLGLGRSMLWRLPEAVDA